MFNSKKRFSSQGFTLIELLVVIIIIGILTVALYLIFDPLTQLNKAKDAQRRHDLEQVRQALDTYFNDKGCYPTSLTFDAAWSVDGTVYMKKLPQDPDCYHTGYCYFYLTDTNNSCPQWNILYTRLSMTPNPFKVGKDAFNAFIDANCSTQKVCQYRNITYTYCVLSGNVDCSLVSGATFPTRSIPSVPTGLPTVTPTPTPPPAPFDCSSTGYYYMSGGQCNRVGSRTICSIYGGPPTNVCMSAGAMLPNPNCTGQICTK